MSPVKHNWRLLVVLIVATVSLFSSASTAEDQDDRRLMYYVGGDKPHLMPLIDRTLSSLRVAGEDRLLFDSTYNLRLIEANRQHNEKFKKSVRVVRGLQSVESSDEGLALYDSLFNVLGQRVKWHLQIDVFELGELLEFQLYLFETVGRSEVGREGGGVRLLRDRPTAMSSTFIDPTDENHETILRNTIMRIFKKSNSKPQPSVLVNGSPLPTDDELRLIALDQEVVIDASQSLDFDTPKEFLIFRWTQSDPRGSVNVPEDEKVELRSGVPVQTFRLPREGLYRFKLVVSDGIVESDTLEVNLKAVQGPSIDIPYPYLVKSAKRPLKVWMSSRLNIVGLKQSLLTVEMAGEDTSSFHELHWLTIDTAANLSRFAHSFQSMPESVVRDLPTSFNIGQLEPFDSMQSRPIGVVEIADDLVAALDFRNLRGDSVFCRIHLLTTKKSSSRYSVVSVRVNDGGIRTETDRIHLRILDVRPKLMVTLGSLDLSISADSSEDETMTMASTGIRVKATGILSIESIYSIRPRDGRGMAASLGGIVNLPWGPHAENVDVGVGVLWHSESDSHLKPWAGITAKFPMFELWGKVFWFLLPMKYFWSSDFSQTEGLQSGYQFAIPL